MLIGGDHLLTRISPAVGLYPESRPDPLGDYLGSLQRTIELAPRISTRARRADSTPRPERANGSCITPNALS